MGTPSLVVTDFKPVHAYIEEAPNAGPIKHSLGLAPVRTPIRVTGQERLAIVVGCFMMLTPLAMAAWGVNHIS